MLKRKRNTNRIQILSITCNKERGMLTLLGIGGSKIIQRKIRRNMKYPKVRVKNWKSWSKWINPVMTNYNMACCDCGLVHTMNFRVIKVIKSYKNGTQSVVVMPKDEYKVEFKLKRNGKDTKWLRNNRKHIKSGGNK